MSNIKIAIINDNFRKIEVLSNILYQEGIEYEVFYSVESFLRTALKLPEYFNGMFLDMQLPQKDDIKIDNTKLGGETILKELQKNGIEIPFIVYSTYWINEEKRKTELYKNMYGQIAWIISSTQSLVFEFLESIVKT